MPSNLDNYRKEVSSWSHLSKLVEHFSYYSGHSWLFRGMSDVSYRLVPRIGRAASRAEKTIDGKKVRTPYQLDDEIATFEMFKQQACAHLPPTARSQWEWLALAQHYGLPTRLLDWTESLLVAAWFAVEANNGAGDAAIWVSRAMPSIIPAMDDEPFARKLASAYRPPYITPRIPAQASVFVICPNPVQELEAPFGQQIVVRHQSRFTLKKRLNACGINRRHLFPDLGGLCEHLTWLYERDWLAGYRRNSSSSS